MIFDIKSDFRREESVKPEWSRPDETQAFVVTYVFAIPGADGWTEREEQSMGHTPEATRRILADPKFQSLASGRARLRWGLSILTLVMFFGFVALISTARGALAATVTGTAIPIGLVLAFAMIVLVVALTGIYVLQSNARFDDLNGAVTREFGQ